MSSRYTCACCLSQLRDRRERAAGAAPDATSLQHTPHSKCGLRAAEAAISAVLCSYGWLRTTKSRRRWRTDTGCSAPAADGPALAYLKGLDLRQGATSSAGAVAVPPPGLYTTAKDWWTPQVRCAPLRVTPGPVLWSAESGSADRFPGRGRPDTLRLRCSRSRATAAFWQLQVARPAQMKLCAERTRCVCAAGLQANTRAFRAPQPLIAAASRHLPPASPGNLRVVCCPACPGPAGPRHQTGAQVALSSDPAGILTGAHPQPMDEAQQQPGQPRMSRSDSDSSSGA